MTMSGSCPIPAKKRRFIEELLEAGSVTGAARAVGVTPRTGRRWLADVGLRAALGRATDGVYAGLASRAGAMMQGALDTLDDIMLAERPLRGAAVQVRAAKVVIDTALRLREVGDLADRVGLLEDRLEVNGG